MLSLIHIRPFILFSPQKFIHYHYHIYMHIKSYPEIFYEFVVWPTIANVYKISGYFLIYCDSLTLFRPLTTASILNLHNEGCLTTGSDVFFIQKKSCLAEIESLNISSKSSTISDAARRLRDAEQNRRREELQRRIEETRMKLQNVR